MKYVYILALIVAVACLGLYAKAGKSYAEMSVSFAVSSAETMPEGQRLDIRFAGESTGSRSAQKFVASQHRSGWDWKKEHPLKFPRSGVLTATACSGSEFVGFVDIALSDGPIVRKDIELIKARPIPLKMLSPQGGTFVLKEFGPIDIPKFELFLNDKKQDILETCSVNFSHFPNNDYETEFELIDGSLVMEDDMVAFHLDGSLGKAFRRGETDTEITITGIAMINGERVGFTASEVLNITVE